MASITNDSNGRKRIQFVATDGSRKAVRLGKCSVKQAEGFKSRVETLQAIQVTGVLDKDTASWLADLDDTMHARLAAVGLVDPRASMTLAGWLDAYLAERKNNLRPKSWAKLDDTRVSLVAFFGPDVPLRKITPQNAADWRSSLEQNLSIASAKTYTGNGKTMMNEAVRRKLIPENPFGFLKGGTTASKYTRFITVEEIERVIAHCPDSEWRLLFGLARFAGLRVPSETHLLTPGSIDWERGRMTVLSPKTEGHAGHEQRLVPVSPRLMHLLQARFDDLKEGESQLVTISGQGNMMRWIRKITAAAGVDLWKRVWQTLRSSCEREWAMSFPQYAVSKWIGHDITVSGKHYTNGVPGELFDKVARGAAQNAAQYPTAGYRSNPRLPGAAPEESQETASSRRMSLEVTGGGGNRTRVP